jgi:photosystem II stability/assembly factor-like uncharacterized protein
MSRLIFCSLCILSASTVIFPTTLAAQWKIVAQNLINYKSGPTSGVLHYKNGNLWAAGSPGADLMTDIWFSPDTGKTWRKQSSLPKFMAMDLRFSDDHTGVIGGCGYDVNSHTGGGPDGGIYITSDQGVTWERSLKRDIIYTVASVESDKHLLAYMPGKLKVSNDGGNSWDSSVISNEIYYIATNTSKKRICYLENVWDGQRRNYNGQFVGSTDNGSTWSKQGTIEDWDNFSMTIDSSNPDIVYVANEGFRAYGLDFYSDILVTSDWGKTWKKTFTRPLQANGLSGYISGSIETSCHAVYFQTMYNGIFRSTDQGNTWINIGGPSVKYDTRVLAVINDNIIFAADVDGNIWATFNSGGDPVPFSSNTTYQFSSTKIITDSSGVIVHLPIYFHHSGSLSNVDMIMHYPGSPLQYLGGALVNGKSIDVPNSQWLSRAQLHFDGSDLNALTDSLVGYVNFKWSPLETDCANIIFDSITSQSFGDCGMQTVAAESFKGIIGAYKWCGESSVEIHQESSLNLTIVPNPSRGIFTVVSNEYLGNAAITLFDELGNTALELKQAMTSSGIRVDGSTLHEGNYFLRIRTVLGKKTYPLKLIK